MTQTLVRHNPSALSHDHAGSFPGVVCPCCGGYALRLLGSLPDGRWFAGKRLAQPLPGGKLYRCHRCQLKFRHPVHDNAVYQQLYDNLATSTWPADIARLDWDLITEHIFEQRPHGGHVLDFGCYSGGLLARLGSAYQRYGVEVNRAAATIASRNICGRVWSSIDDIPRDLSFDVVIAADVVEHMMNPMDLIERLAALMTDHGILIITTGDADNFLWNRFGANWWYCFNPEHIAFLSEAWIDHLCKATGMAVVRCDTFRYCNRSPVRHFIHSVLTYCYGWFPATFLFFGSFLKKLLGRSGMSSVTGSGVSRDHLFIVLAKMAKP